MKTKTELAPIAPTTTGLSLFDSGQFEQMLSVANAMSLTGFVPDTLKGKTPEETKYNCLRVVEQASRWDLSPYAVMDCASVVHGKLMWEGKLISAALEATIGIRLSYEYSGDGQQRKIIVSGSFQDEDKPRTIEGTVADWKTTGKGSPWDKASQHDQQLSYRGAREWARRHAPGTILGVYSPDEFNEGELRDATPKSRVQIREDYKEPEKPAAKKIEAKSEKETSEILTREARVVSVTEKEGTNKSIRSTVTLEIKGKKVKTYTFSKRVGQNAKELVDEMTTVEIDFDSVTKDCKLVSVTAGEASTEGELI